MPSHLRDFMFDRRGCRLAAVKHVHTAAARIKHVHTAHTVRLRDADRRFVHHTDVGDLSRVFTHFTIVTHFKQFQTITSDFPKRKGKTPKAVGVKVTQRM